DEAMTPAGGFLRGLLEHGPVASKQIRADAEAAGYAWRTIQRGRKALTIEAYREGFGKEGVWYWRLAARADDGVLTSPKTAKEPKDGHGGDLGVAETKSKAKAARVAKRLMQPSTIAGVVISQLGNFFKLDMMTLIDHLQDGVNDISKNDLGGCEAMLYCQAQALQAVFSDLLLQATQQEWFPHYETFMRIALKAQNQSRTTLETLATIKNPPAVFAWQANIAHGPQQVNNNGMMPAGEPRAGARETEKPHNELLEETPHERLDTGTTGAGIGFDPAMAAVGAINRAEDGGG
ncbi:MAG: hypothetical protein ACREV8_15820, partial [Gammaproteobacteria bacterium]